MKGNNRILMMLLAACLLLGPAFRTHAQEDTLRVKEEPGIFDMKMQHRYTPSHQPFQEPGRNAFLRILENSSISLSGSYHRWLDPDLSSGPSLTLSLGKWVSPTHGFRIEAGTGYFFNNENRSRVKMLPDIRISHLFNLSAYLDGYNPLRLGDLYTIAGAGYIWQYHGQETGSWTAQLGLGYSMHILRGTDLFVEPVWELNGNGFVQQQDGNWRGYYGGFRGNVGISYRIDRWNPLLPPKREHRWFLMATGGPAWLVYTPSSAQKAGYQVTLGAGERLTRAVSVRLTGSWTQAFLPSDSQVQAHYGALRLEGMLDLLGLGRQDERPLSLSVMAGPEVGFMDRTQADKNIYGRIGRLGSQFYYVGATAGVQLNTRIFKRFHAFLEPRASLVPYTVLNAADNKVENTLDVLVSANLGLQYAIPTVEDRRAAWERTKQWSRDSWDKTVEWDRRTWDEVNERWDRTRESLRRTGQRMNLFASLEGSYFRPLGRDFANGPMASLSLGTWFHPQHGAMINTGLGYFQDLQYGNGYVKTMEFSASYLFNLTNFAKGWDPDRQVSLSLLAGAGYMMPLREKWTGSAIFRTGLDLRMHVLPRTDMVVRPEMDFLKAPSDVWSPALRGTFGLSYSMGGAPVANFSDKGREWYVLAGAGFQNEILRLASQKYEEDPYSEYRINVGVGRKYSARMDWRLSVSYLSELHNYRSSTFAHRLRFASVNIDALYNLVGDELVDRRWSLSLVGGPEIGLQHKSNEGEDIKGSGLIFQRSTISAYLGVSAGVQMKYRFTDGLSIFLEPKYTLAPYVARTTTGDENYYSHVYGTNFGLEYAFGRNRYLTPGIGEEEARERKERAIPYFFIQTTGTIIRPFGAGYGQGPLVNVALGYWFRGASGVMLDYGLGYFRDNQLTVGADGREYRPQHMATMSYRASYLLSLSRLATRNAVAGLPVEAALMAGVGYMLPEFKQKETGTLSAHAGFDFRIHVLPGTDLVVEPQLELFKDPHAMVDGTRKGLAGAFRGTFGASYNLSRRGILPAQDPGKDWFINVSAGYQNESGRLSGPDAEDVYHNEYRIYLGFGRRYSNAFSLRLGGSYSEITPQEGSFLHSLRYTSANLDFIYDLMANEAGDNRVSLGLLAGPEVGFANKSHGKAGQENPMTLPLKIMGRRNHGVTAYVGLSAGLQLKVKVVGGLSLYLEQRYSMVPYVSLYSSTDHRNMTTHLWNASFGVQYSFGQK